jgi:hypothetical protein
MPLRASTWRKKGRHSCSDWCGGRHHGGMPLHLARRESPRLSEFLPPHQTDQAARWAPRKTLNTRWPPKTIFAELASGLVCLTEGTESPFVRIFAEEHLAAAKESALKQLGRMTQLFAPRNIHVELQRHARRGQETGNRILIELARGMRLRLEERYEGLSR